MSIESRIGVGRVVSCVLFLMAGCGVGGERDDAGVHLVDAGKPGAGTSSDVGVGQDVGDVRDDGGDGGSEGPPVGPWKRMFGTAGWNAAYDVAREPGRAVYFVGATDDVLAGAEPEGRSDGYLAKYSEADREVEWVKTFGTEARDWAVSVELADYGIYVGGTSEGGFGDGGNSDGVDGFVAQFSRDGTQQWSKAVATSEEDGIRGLVGMPNGDVVAVGHVGAALDGQSFAGGRSDVAVVRYAADGTRAWTRVFGSNGADWAEDVAADQDGVYVGGVTQGSFGGESFAGGEAGGFLASLRDSGATERVTFVQSSGTDKVNAVGVKEGTIWVGGQTAGPLAGFRLKGRSDGFVLGYDRESGKRTRSYRIGGDGRDSVRSLAVGTALIGFGGFSTARLESKDYAGGDADGMFGWLNPESESLHAVELVGSPGTDAINAVSYVRDDNRLVVAGETSGDIAFEGNWDGDSFLAAWETFAAGNVEGEWGEQLHTEGNEAARAVDVGPDGSVYVAGFATSDVDGDGASGKWNDAYVKCFDAAGEERWTQVFGESGPSRMNDVVVRDGAVYVVGRTYGTWTGETESEGDSADSTVSKLTADGERVWDLQFGADEFDDALAVAVAEDGTVYVGGQTNGGILGEPDAGGGDGYLAEVSPQGELHWARVFGSGNWDRVQDVKVDAAGTVYATGWVGRGFEGRAVGGGRDGFVVTYSGKGERVATKLIDSGGVDTGQALALRPEGGFLVLGDAGQRFTRGHRCRGGYSDSYVASFDAEMNRRWVSMFGTGQIDLAEDLTRTDNGDIIVGGYSPGHFAGRGYSGGETDGFVMRFSPDGRREHLELVAGAGRDVIRGVAVGPAGGVFVAGYTRSDLWGQSNSGGRADAFVGRFDSLE